jgi:hypothetical protein
MMSKIFNRRYLLKNFFWVISAIIGTIYSHKVANAKEGKIVRNLERDDFRDVFDDEQVYSFFSEKVGLAVTFSDHASIYYLLKEREDFVEQARNLAAAWRARKPVKIILKGLEIISVGEL